MYFSKLFQPLNIVNYIYFTFKLNAALLFITVVTGERGFLLFSTQHSVRKMSIYAPLNIVNYIYFTFKLNAALLFITVVTGERGFLLFSTQHSVRKMSIYTRQYSDIVWQRRKIVGLDYDHKSGFVYYSDLYMKKIQRVPLRYSGQSFSCLTRMDMLSIHVLSTSNINVTMHRKTYFNDFP